ncbi:proline dehydrogenase family protein [Sanguibacter suaedae]|uniref:L-glutamate gamma-semialdehyde dehydrogenase n=1 Tax=Sanguibacter suaedae TaxID=2795737 RepID=A0A934MAN5_9MICO|nr:bifunctional proline dehydrogenase/L-glutamate gamma-semialdehyde dehydrogenase [Sanguibacter suaedae]MBI9115963.1 bifunctional proline dehydrogenase/L-glutamate gamma-semialdehyde dehydrogenase [Sanguibacter suaedae]
MTRTPPPVGTPPADMLTDSAVELAQHWMAATAGGGSGAERRAADRLGQLVSDPAGLELAVAFVDRVARPDDVHVAARELGRLADVAGSASFLGPADRALLVLGARLAPLMPHVVVPAARTRLRQLVGHLVADAGPGLGRHLARTRADGFRLNVNLLGEAVLGEREAVSRTERVLDLVRRPDVDYVSVKTSAVVSQLSTWDTEGSVRRVLDRLRPLYLTARDNGTFINLDMEEYRDLDLTVRVFEELLADPELADLEMGIVLQAYLPDAGAGLDAVTAAATRRVDAGGAPVKVRLVKGANLAMERVEAELHGWAQAPYTTKADVDANYVRLVDRALAPERTRAVRVGVASHNLFHVAHAHLLAASRGVEEALDIEMLQGMAPAQARAVRDTVGRVLLYTPAVAQEDFDVAVSYLVRRLEENAAEQNFLHAAFAGGDSAIDRQEAAYRESVRAAATVSTEPRRRATQADDATAAAGGAGGDVAPFDNAPDTDAAVAESRRWALGLIDPVTDERLLAELPPVTTLSTADDADAAVARAVAQTSTWAETPVATRAAVLRSVADHLEAARGDLVATMVHEAGKTVGESDPEVSEAVDFARWYAEQSLRLDPEHPDADPGAVFHPHGVTVVTPPWNFPVAIPLGSVLGALAAGSPVIIKPSHVTPRCARVGMAAVHRALDDHGIDRDVAQVVLSDEGDVGQRLVTHPDVTRVILTGAIETARRFTSWRSDLEVLAETSGKNALVVTPSADVDLAVADVVRSAFGHAGQKCSAASLLILVGSAGRSDRLRRQLADAVSTLRVGYGTSLSTTMGPLTEAASGKLLRALTTLEPGERWLVEPRRLSDDGHLWTPGVRYWVAPGSFFHMTEVFGPVLGVMRVDTLDEAIALQNAVEFGLTGGIHSLDEDEIDHWLERVEVGNAYVNRHITGAIVRRQPFGGWKASVVGPGAKAGGPDYVAQLGVWEDSPAVPSADTAPQEWLDWARADDGRWWRDHFSVEHDPSGLTVESNVLRYRPLPHLTVRAGDGAAQHHVDRVLAAAHRAGVPVTVSTATEESHEAFARRVADGEVTGRVRLVGDAPGLADAAAPLAGQVEVDTRPVLASGRRELLAVVREQAVSRTRHRFGHLDARTTGA